MALMAWSHPLPSQPKILQASCSAAHSAEKTTNRFSQVPKNSHISQQLSPPLPALDKVAGLTIGRLVFSKTQTCHRPWTTHWQKTLLKNSEKLLWTVLMKMSKIGRARSTGSICSRDLMPSKALPGEWAKKLRFREKQPKRATIHIISWGNWHMLIWCLKKTHRKALLLPGHNCGSRTILIIILSQPRAWRQV